MKNTEHQKMQGTNQQSLNQLFDQEGNKISPVLSKKIKNYLIDIDGTITEDVPNEEPERMKSCLPFPDALETLNKWYDDGHIITFFTSRTEDMRGMTIEWLDNAGFKYHGLLMNKPRGGNYHWIDNHIVKATRYKNKFTDLIKVSKEIEVFDDEDEA